MWSNLQETAVLITFAEEMLNGKLHFLCSVSLISSSFGENSFAAGDKYLFKFLGIASIYLRIDKPYTIYLRLLSKFPNLQIRATYKKHVFPSNYC